MTAALRNLEEGIAKLEEASERVRAETRDANAATKALRQTAKEVRDLLALEPGRIVKEVLEEAVRVGLEGYVGEIKTYTDDARASVFRAFDELAGVLLGYERRDPDDDAIGLTLAKRGEMVGVCPRCAGPTAARRYAIEVAALDGDEVPLDGRRFAVLERYFCQRRRSHYGTVIVDTIDERHVEAELGEVEARRHRVGTLERDAAAITDALTTDTEET